jgi:hypothetical protein
MYGTATNIVTSIDHRTMYLLLTLVRQVRVHDMTHTCLMTVLSFRSTCAYHYHHKRQEVKVIPGVFDPHVFCSLHLSLLDLSLGCR